MGWVLFVCLLTTLGLSNAESLIKDGIVLEPQQVEKVDGYRALLPCIVVGIGSREHGQTFTKGNFHYKCVNATAEVIACVASDMSVIQIGRTFLKDGIRHRCNVQGETATYEQRATCFSNGIHYDIGESFRNGSFKLICKEIGIAIEGCYVQNSTVDVVPLGDSRIINNQKHSCELLEGGKIRYMVHLLGCRKDKNVYGKGQIWTDAHIRYQCTNEGTTKVLGCIDDEGLFIDLGRDILLGGIVHRCYKVNTTTFYHRFECNDGKSLHECVGTASIPKRIVRSVENRQH